MQQDDIVKTTIGNGVLDSGHVRATEEMPISVLIVSRGGRIVHGNRMFRKAYGYSEHLDGLKVEEILPGYTREKMLDDLRTMAAKPHHLVERALVTDFGERRWVLVKLSELGTGGRVSVVMLTLTDVTHLRRHVQETTAQITKLYHLADVSNDVILSVNEQGYVDHVNDAGCRLLGYRLTDVIGQPLSSIVTRRGVPSTSSAKGDGRRAQGAGPATAGVSSPAGSSSPAGGPAARRHPKPVRAFAIRSCGERIPVEMLTREVPLPGKWIHIVSLQPLARPGNGLAGNGSADPLEESGDMVKKRIGQDLHDTLGQLLTGMRMMGSQLLKSVKEGESVAEGLKEILDLLKEADEFTHILAHGMLRPLDKGTLADHLRSECERVSRLFRVECRVETHLATPILDPLIMTNLVPIVQEALSNAIRHGQAGRIMVTLRESDHEWVLAVEDDGMGLRRREPSNPHSGLGMKIMSERAELLGGRLRLRRTHRSTTRLECTIPKQDPTETTPSGRRIRHAAADMPLPAI